MDKLIINGPCKLSGTVTVSSSKNASLPILAAAVLADKEISFTELPGLSDISFFLKILESLGAKVTTDKKQTVIDCSQINNVKADYDLVRKMRASVLVLGPLLSRFGEAVISLPGGCAIGTRPVDIHLSALEKMGAKIKIEKGYIYASCDRLKGANIEFPFPSVGATENIMMAAAYADGVTTIKNAAREPEIEDLANFLKALGVSVSGAGTSQIEIIGKNVGELNCEAKNYKVIGDRIEAATFIIAALICDSEIEVLGFNPIHLEAVLDQLKKMGAKLEILPSGVKVLKSGKLNAVTLETEPFPGFPTDVQAQMMTLMGLSCGTSKIEEKIFENRFMHVPELVRMGMDIDLDGNTATIKGVEALSAAPVMCTDLRASAALILAGLFAKGSSDIGRIYHLDRGYEKIEEKLSKLGADIQRVSL